MKIYHLFIFTITNFFILYKNSIVTKVFVITLVTMEFYQYR
jgi:hypothetical protein